MTISHGGLCATTEATYLVAAIVSVLLVAIRYHSNPKRYKVKGADVFKNHALFVGCTMLGAFFLSDRPCRAAFTLLVVNVMAHQQHLMAHTVLPKFCKPIAFHHFVHHDPRRGPTIDNILREFVLNVLSVGILYVPTQFNILDARVCVMMGLVYATYHLVNQRVLESAQHRQHHEKNSVNLGPDYMDILLHTKGDGECENMNSGAWNILLCTSIVAGGHIIRNRGRRLGML